MRDKYCGWLRNPRTTAEKRANQEGWERPKRRPHNLADAWDDMLTTKTKCWKDHRKTQYRPGGRGKHHQIRVEVERGWRNWGCLSNIRLLEDYCKDHNVPYYIEEVKKFRWTERINWERKPESEWKKYEYGDFTYYHPTYNKIHTGEYYRLYYTDYYIFHWWSNKDIGVEYILKDGHSNPINSQS